MGSPRTRCMGRPQPIIGSGALHSVTLLSLLVSHAMPEVEAPLVGGKVDTDDWGGSARSIAMAVGGVALGGIVLSYGSQLGDWATTRIDNLAGTNASGNAGFGLMGDL